MWRRAPWCGEGRPGVDEDAWMPLEREGGTPGSKESASKEREQ